MVAEHGPGARPMAHDDPRRACAAADGAYGRTSARHAPGRRRRSRPHGWRSRPDGKPPRRDRIAGPPVAGSALRRGLRANALDRPLHLGRADRPRGRRRDRPISGQPELRATPVRIVPVAVLWRGVLLRRSARPLSGPCYWARLPLDAGHAFALAGWEPLPRGRGAETWITALLDAPSAA